MIGPLPRDPLGLAILLLALIAVIVMVPDFVADMLSAI